MTCISLWQKQNTKFDHLIVVRPVREKTTRLNTDLFKGRSLPLLFEAVVSLSSEPEAFLSG